MSNKPETTKVINEVLKSLASAGALTAAITVPGLAVILEDTLKKRHSWRAKQDAERLAAYLKTQKLVEVQERPDGTCDVSVTIGGWRRVQKYNVQNMTLAIPKKWDEQWRIVMFDIPEKKKHARNVLTTKLRSLGFKQWQRSVWVYPFECEIEMMTIAQLYEVDQYVNYLVVARSNVDDKLYRTFRPLLTDK